MLFSHGNHVNAWGILSVAEIGHDVLVISCLMLYCYFQRFPWEQRCVSNLRSFQPHLCWPCVCLFHVPHCLFHVHSFSCGCVWQGPCRKREHQKFPTGKLSKTALMMTPQQLNRYMSSLPQILCNRRFIKNGETCIPNKCFSVELWESWGNFFYIYCIFPQEKIRQHNCF